MEHHKGVCIHSAKSLMAMHMFAELGPACRGFWNNQADWATVVGSMCQEQSNI